MSNEEFNMQNTYIAGMLPKSVTDKPMFNASQIQSQLVQFGEPSEGNILIYSSVLDRWVYSATGITGPTGAEGPTGPTGPTGPYLLNEATVAGDRLANGALYSSVSAAVDGMGTATTAYFIRIIGDTTETTLSPTWASGVDYEIEIAENVTWTLNLSTAVTASANAELYIAGPGTLAIQVSDTSIQYIFQLTAGYKLYFYNLNLSILNSAAPDTFRTIVSPGVKLDIYRCNIVMDDQMTFRYGTGTTEETRLSCINFTGTGAAESIYDTRNSTGLNVLKMNNFKYTGKTLDNFLMSGTSISNRLMINDIETNFTSGSASAISLYGKWNIHNFKDIGTKACDFSLYSGTNNLLSNIDCKSLTLDTSATGTLAQNIWISSTGTVSASSCQLSDITCDSLVISNKYTNLNNINVATNLIMDIDATGCNLNNITTSSLSIIGEDNNLYDITVNDTLDIDSVDKLAVSNCKFTDTSNILTIGSTGARFTNCEFSANGGDIEITQCHNSFNNCTFRDNVTWYSDVRGQVCNCRFEGTTTITSGGGATGPLFVCNFGVPLNGPTDSMSGSNGNSPFL